ncbi:beta-galactosidase trimerization domain-containing protein [Paenibacillus sp. N4]|uniref:beta-galactosidase trimerization domain-containing protein n=1 Tax=Paenibacillus vietnamensis TaxID=2590547 RepID=UPI001CD137D9|nr:beta-galactosidase trimerization domain-containing protein [Paenibacillus vietnamensis]MCA0755802.1 beta-galactosidase trimerization domain-containing protein [Paenibacillus vietnamensis]
MQFRQVHLDFHTTEKITNIAKNFSKEQFQEMLRLGHVDSITVFAKCHHGWAYFPSETNEIHPHLEFDLLQQQMEAAHEIGVKAPVYLSVGLDERMARLHPEWLMRNEKDETNWVNGFMTPGFHQFCLNSPYLDLMIVQIEEVVRKYDADGIFLDIVGVRQCYCHTCIAQLHQEGKDPRVKSNIVELGERIYSSYTRRVEEAVHAIKPGMPIFHNAGHISQGRRDLAAMNTHLELESLPTGGWGYDHFPLSARYVQQLGMDFLGMTGKFHTFWGEFGGYKHPNALRYETALSLANGARCSIGDQLHPEGLMDPATYRLIGAAYSEVERKEKWCVNVTNTADIGLLTVEAAGASQENDAMFTGKSDAGAVRMLLEGHFLFDVIDLQSDFNRYKVIILPDHIVINEPLHMKLTSFLESGGKVLATGNSGLNPEQTHFILDLGVRDAGSNPYQPDYFRPLFPLEPLGDASYIFYANGRRVELDGGEELGKREDPYFNRDVYHFCSHQHTPSSLNDGGPGMVLSACGIYVAWNVFEDYAVKGSLALKEVIVYALNLLLPDKTLQTSLPAQGIVTLQEQASESRYINHLLYASPVKRGDGIEIIEDMIPLSNIRVTLRLPGKQVTGVYTAPDLNKVAFTVEGETLNYQIDQIIGHQMVVIDYE